jgi:hypothetical protein
LRHPLLERFSLEKLKYGICNYTKYLLREGTLVEKRELLFFLKKQTNSERQKDYTQIKN